MSTRTAITHTMDDDNDDDIESLSIQRQQQQQQQMYTSLSKSDVENESKNTNTNSYVDNVNHLTHTTTNKTTTTTPSPHTTLLTTTRTTSNNTTTNTTILLQSHTSLSNIPCLICAIIASATTGGTSYAFGIYSTTLKHNLQLSQSQLDSISTSFFVAGLFNFISGYCSDLYGTKFAMSLGGCTGSISLLLYWYIAKQFIIIQSKSILVILLCILGITTFLSCGLVTGAVFKIIVTSTGLGTKGSAVGVAKGYVGLGAGLYACLFQAIQSYNESDLDFLPMAAILFICCATIPAQLLLPSKQQQPQFVVSTSMGTNTILQDDCTPYHFRTLYCSLIVLAVIIICTTLYKLYSDESHKYHSNNSNGRSYGMIFLILSIWLGPIISLYFLPRATDSTSTSSTIGTATRNDYNIVDTSTSSFIDDDDDNDIHPTTSATSNVLLSKKQRKQQHQQPYRDINNEIPPDVLLVNHNESIIEHPTPNISSTKRSEFDTNENKEEDMIIENGDNHYSHRDHNGIHRNTVVSNNEDSSNNDDNVDDEGDEYNHTNGTDDEVNMNLFQMIQTPTAMIMVYTTILLVGAGTVQTNNMGQMVESLQFTKDDNKAITSTALAFFSVAQAASRVCTGSISEAALNWNTNLFGIRKGIPRPFFMIIASLVGCIAHGILAYAGTINVFVFGVTLSGFAFGMVWPLMVLLSAEIFGVNGAGQNYMFYDGVSSAGGTLLMSKFIAQYVYDTNIDPNSSDTKTCIGIQCFQLTHIIVALLCLSCCISSFMLMYMSRHTYNKPILHTH